MAKIIKYNLKTQINTGTEREPVWEYVQGPKCSMPYSESNMAIAEAEAYGDITVEDDGQPEPEVPETVDSRVTALEDKLAAMEAAYIEGVQNA